MKLMVRRFDKEIPLPEYKTKGAAAMDLAAREDVTIEPKSAGVLSLNVAVKPPQGHFVLMAARSSLWKRGLTLVNGVGILDEDYCGDGDEYHAALYNFSDKAVEIKKGERVTQMIVLPYDKVIWNEVDFLGSPDRGAYGTTGV